MNLVIYSELLDKIIVRSKEINSSFYTDVIEVVEKDLQNAAKLSENLPRYHCGFDESGGGIQWKATCYIHHILLKLLEFQSSDWNEQTIKSVTETILLLRNTGTNFYLLDELQKLKVIQKSEEHITFEKKFQRLLGSLCVLQKFFRIKLVATYISLKEIGVDYIAGLFTLYYWANWTLKEQDMIEKSKIEGMILELNNIFPTETIFKNLLVIKSVEGAPKEFSVYLHKELLRQIGQAGGYQIFCKTLLDNIPANDESPQWKRNEVIANIVGCKGHSKKFYHQILDDVFDFYAESLYESDDRQYLQTCISSMKKIYSLGYKELQTKISNFFIGVLENLQNPENVLTGAIVLEGELLSKTLFINYMAFSGSNHTSLNSSILTPVVPILIRLHALLRSDSEEVKYLQSMIVFCLANREKADLKDVVESIVCPDDCTETFKMFHNRITVKFAENGSYSLQIGVSDTLIRNNIAQTFVGILKNSNHNILIYNIFMILLKFVDESSRESGNNQSELLTNDDEDDEEIGTLISNRFLKRFVIIETVSELIAFKKFHHQLYQNPREILEFIKTLLVNRLQTDDNLIILVLSIFREYLQKLKSRDESLEIIGILKNYKNSNKGSTELRKQIDSIISEDPTSTVNIEQTPFKMAMGLCAEAEPYCKVYGMSLLIKLLKERNEEAISNKHALLIVALENLRNDESYAFLNTVRLLVALTDVLESEVVETLIKEYQTPDSEIDFRLKVGEAIVKITATLGSIAYKYKDLLINCFLKECQHPVQEFRTSSFSNLGSICKVLAYQVHNFFYEMFLLIESTIQMDTYLPCRRAAMHVLSQLIDGIDTLISFQDYLLHIYRLLKYVIATDDDQTTKMHAAIALEKLNVKTKEFLLPAEAKLEREIKILGINDENEESGKSLLKKIIELN